MTTPFRRLALCVCLFVPLLWAWLAAPTYDSTGRDDWQMPGPLGSSVFDNVGNSYASLGECIANPSLLGDTYARYGHTKSVMSAKSSEAGVRYLHGLYAMDALRSSLLYQSRTAIRNKDLFTATLAGVGAIENACLQVVWITMRGPENFVAHASLGVVFLVLAVSLQLLLRRHAG